MKSIELIIEVELSKVQSANYNSNIERYGDHDNTCIICGKRVKNIENSKLVQMLTNGNIVSTDQEIEGSQGFFSVGSDCSKKLKILFTF